MLPVTSAPGGAGAAVAETKSKQRCMFFWIAVIVACTIVFLVKPLKHVPEMPFTSGTGGRSSTAAAACRNQVISDSYTGAYVVTAAHAKNFAQVEQLVASLQAKRPSLRIAVFDVGLSEQQLESANQWLNVAVFHLGLDRYPAHVANLKAGVYRVLVINEAAAALGKIVYVEPGYVAESDLFDLEAQLADTGLICAPSKRATTTVLPAAVRPHLGLDDEMVTAGTAVSTNIVAVDTASALYSSIVRAAAFAALDRASVPAEFADTALLTAQALLYAKEKRAAVCTAELSSAIQAAFRLDSQGSQRHTPLKRCADATWQAPDPSVVAKPPDTDPLKGDDAHADEHKGHGHDSGSSKPVTPPPAKPTVKVESRQDIMNRVVGDPDELNPAMAAVLENGYTGYTLVTSGSGDFYERMKNLIGSVHFWAPEMPILVHDLGLEGHQVAELKRMKNVLDVRAFPFDQYPPHFRDLHTYAFKPTVMLQTLEERFKILYLDTSMELRQSPQPIFDLLKRDGTFYVVQEGKTTNMLCCGNVDELTVEGTLQALGITRAEVGSKHMCAGGIQGYYLGSRAYHEVLVKAARCARDVNCIAPPGSGIPNHRFDQSVFSALINHVGGITCREEPIFWGNEINLGSQRPTADETQSNGVVLYTRRGRGGSPYVRHIKYKS